MKADTENHQPSHLVLVVGVDLTDVSEHLLAQTRALIRPIDSAEVHVVHVVRPGPLRSRLEATLQLDDISAGSQAEHANRELKRLCDALALGPRTRVLVHTPIGNAADEVTRIALDVHADMVVVEAHLRDTSESHRLPHRCVVARIARTAPCTVLALRNPSPPPVPISRSPLTANWSTRSV